MMPQNQLPPIQYHKIRSAFKSFLSKWQWDLHVTLTFENQTPYPVAFKKGKDWLKDIKDSYPDIRFAGLVFISSPNLFTMHPHIHCPLISDPTYPKTLMDIYQHKLPRLLWWDGICTITTKHDWSNETLANYLAKRKNINLEAPDRWDFQIYRPKLLERLRKHNSNSNVGTSSQPRPTVESNTIHV